MRCLLAITGGGQAGNLSCASAVCVLAHPDAPRRRQRRDLIRARRLDPSPLPEEQWFWQQLARLSAAIAREMQPQGGVLVHSGLASYAPSPGSDRHSSEEGRGESGILLTGRSGVGKSTASQRLSRPWRALADDVTLVMRGSPRIGSAYQAHSWPTWSRFFGPKAGDGSDSWDVQQAVPLRAIVVLEQGSVDHIEPLGPGHTVALLAELAQQASAYLLLGMPHAELAAFHLQQFDNLCALVQALPAYLLHTSRDGTFWTEIEGVIL